MEHFCEVYKNKKEFAIYGARVLNRETTILITDVKPIKHDVKMDLCLLESKNHMVTPVNFAQEFYGSTRIGKEVFSIGAPMGFFPVRVDGYIIQGYGSMTMTDDKDDSMLLSLNQNPGSSGSPVFLKSTNEVIGSVDAIDSKFSQLTSAIPLPYIREFLKIDEQQVQR